MTLLSGVSFKNVKNKQWQRMRSQNLSSLQTLHPQIWWNLNGRCMPRCLHFCSLFTLTPCIQSLAFVQPCWSLHLPCRSFVPATLALLVRRPSTSQVPYLQLACEWTSSIVAAPSSPGLGKSLRIFHPSSRKRKNFLSSVSVAVWPCFPAVQMACRVRCSTPANSSGLTGKLGWNRRLFIHHYAGACPCVFLVSVPQSSYIPAMRIHFRNVGIAALDEILKSAALCVLGRCRNQRWADAFSNSDVHPASNGIVMRSLSTVAPWRNRPSAPGMLEYFFCGIRSRQGWMWQGKFM